MGHVTSAPILSTGQMRSNASVIVGAPIASWALYGCFTLAGVSWHTAGTIALAWGALWLALAQMERLPRWIAREARAQRRSVRRRWMDAILATLFLPLPVLVLGVVIRWLDPAAGLVTIPLLAVLAAPVPMTVWWAVLRPLERRDDNLRPMLISHRFDR